MFDLQQYIPILIFFLIAVGLGLVPLVIVHCLRPSRPDPAKHAPYECGFDPFEDARIPFDVKFYLVAILFIIFDLETAFLFPWAVVYRTLGWAGLVAMGIFLGLLVLGFVYEWRRGALEWE